MVLQKYCTKYLEHWKNLKKWDEKLLLKLIEKHNMPLIKIEIKNKKVKMLKDFNAKHRTKREKALTFLQDIAKVYPKLDIIIYLNLKDTLNKETINAYNIECEQIENPRETLNDFHYGVSKLNSDILRMIKTEPIKKYKNSYPVFCFECDRSMNGILFPTFGADNDDIKKSINIDPLKFEQKKDNVVFFRGRNLCTDIRNLDKFEMINLSLKNPEKYDFKMNMKERTSDKIPKKESENNNAGKFVCPTLVKFCQNKGVLDRNKSYEEIKDYLVDNFVEFDDIFKHKLLLTVGSAKNRKWYLSNSCILEYRFKNKEYFYEEVFCDMESIVYVNHDTLDEKVEKLRENNYKLAKQITENRKKVFMEYLHYPNLVKWYGKFLLEYQKIKNNKR